MSLLWISVGALGGLFYLLLKGHHTLQQKRLRLQSGGMPTEWALKAVEQALASGEESIMIAALEETDDPLLQDALLTRIVATYYRRRSEPAARELFYHYAGRHIEMIPSVLTVLGQSGNERPVRMDTFKMAAIAMEEDKRYAEAIALCNSALSLGLENGTKTGFEGRIARLKKKQYTAGTPDPGV